MCVAVGDRLTFTHPGHHAAAARLNCHRRTHPAVLRLLLLLFCLCLQVCALFEQAINAEGLDVDLDQVAAAAMAAVESAVKDEVEAATVVSATQTALASILKDLQAISGKPEEAKAIADVVAALESTDSGDTTSMDGSGGATPAGSAIQLLDSLTAGAAGGAAAGGLLQAVEKGGAGGASSNGTPSSSSAPSAVTSPAPSPTPSGAPPPVDQAKVKAAAAKAKLLQAAGFAVAAALAVAFYKSAAGEVSSTGRGSRRDVGNAGNAAGWRRGRG